MTKEVKSILIKIVLVGALAAALFVIVQFTPIQFSPYDSKEAPETSLNNPFRPKPALPQGSATYQIASAQEIWPKFVQATINPPDVHVGDKQKFNVLVQGPDQIISVLAKIETDNGVNTVELRLKNKAAQAKVLPPRYVVDKTGRLSPSSSQKTTGVINKTNAAEGELFTYEYEGEWIVRDTHDTFYHTTFVAKDAAGRENSITLAWSDACGIPASGDWTISSPCTISSPDGVDGGNAIISTSTLTLNSTFVYNPGQSVQISGAGSIAIGSGGSLKQSYLWFVDQDQDGYTANASATVADSSPGGNYFRSSGYSTSSATSSVLSTTASTSTYGTRPWTSPGNITALDGVYASSSGLTSSLYTNYLIAPSFNLRIPQNASTTFFKVEVRRKYSGGNGVTEAGSGITLVNAYGTTYTTSTGAWTTSDATSTVTCSSISACNSVFSTPEKFSDMQVKIAVRGTGASASVAWVDGITVTVAYTTTALFGSGDCYDNAATSSRAYYIHPGQTNYFTVSSTYSTAFDYNCSGSEEKNTTEYDSGCTTIQNSVCNGTPSCGPSVCGNTTSTTPGCGSSYNPASCAGLGTCDVAGPCNGQSGFGLCVNDGSVPTQTVGCR